MYDRAPRVLSRPFGSTTAGVGPGTYNLADKRPKESYAPFLSMGVRESFLTVNESLAAAPGPGHYTPMFAYDAIKGGGSLNNKTDRFYSPPSKVPGPGAYTVAKPSDWIRKTYPPPKNKTGPHRDSVKVGQMTFHRQPTAPSIPMPGQNYGYDEDPHGNLRPQILPPRDTTMGPAYYNVSREDTNTTKKYKGVHFGHLKAKRSQFKGSEGPGPGDYDPHMNDTRDGAGEGSRHDAQNQSTSGHISNLPRYHELVTRMEMKKAVPGPGKYEIKSQFSRSQSPDDEDPDVTGTVAPFGSRLQRFLSPKHASPSCTTYQLPHSTLNKGSGSGRAPFGQSSTRFKPNRLAKQLPGPGAYNNEQMTSLTTELTKKAMLQGIQKYPFGTTSVRTAPLTKKDEFYMPGPAHYQRDTVEGAEETSDLVAAHSSIKPHGNSPRLSYTFASTSKRLYSPPRIVTDIPPPGSYEISESFSKTQGKAEQGGLGAAKTAFLSTADRFVPPRDILLEEPDALNPGPGEYDSASLLGKGKQGLLCSKDDRFKDIKNTVPGPGAYEMSRTQRDTLLQGTFNTTLSNTLNDEGSNVKPSVSRKRPKFVLGV